MVPLLKLEDLRHRWQYALAPFIVRGKNAVSGNLREKAAKLESLDMTRVFKKDSMLGVLSNRRKRLFLASQNKFRR